MSAKGGAVLVTLFLAAGTAWAGGGKIKWETDYQKGLADAKNSGKPILIYFGADW